MEEVYSTPACALLYCSVSLWGLKLSHDPYYRWRTQQITTSEICEVYRANALYDAHRDDPEFGYRFLVAEAAQIGEVMCERTVWRICRDNQWFLSLRKEADQERQASRATGPR